jgi:S-adenosylmethionine synthetase
MFEECKCESQFSIEVHGEGYALYYDRCPHKHGYNLINMVEPAFNFDPNHIEKLVNLGHKKYSENPDSGHLAE